MAYDREEGQGALFKNDKKEEGSNQPDYTGVLKAGGKDMRIAAWIKESANGNKFMSLKMSEFQEKREPSLKEQIADSYDDMLKGDKVPF